MSKWPPHARPQPPLSAFRSAYIQNWFIWYSWSQSLVATGPLKSTPSAVVADALLEPAADLDAHALQRAGLGQRPRVAQAAVAQEAAPSATRVARPTTRVTRAAAGTARTCARAAAGGAARARVGHHLAPTFCRGRLGKEDGFVRRLSDEARLEGVIRPSRPGQHRGQQADPHEATGNPHDQTLPARMARQRAIPSNVDREHLSAHTPLAISCLIGIDSPGSVEKASRGPDNQGEFGAEGPCSVKLCRLRRPRRAPAGSHARAPLAEIGRRPPWLGPVQPVRRPRRMSQ